MGVTDIMSGQYCRGRRPGILDAVHALKPARSKVVVKLGARRAPSFTLCGRDIHALCGSCVVPSWGHAVQGRNTSVRGPIYQWPARHLCPKFQTQFQACFRVNWVYKFGHWSKSSFALTWAASSLYRVQSPNLTYTCPDISLALRSGRVDRTRTHCPRDASSEGRRVIELNFRSRMNLHCTLYHFSSRSMTSTSFLGGI